MGEVKEERGDVQERFAEFFQKEDYRVKLGQLSVLGRTSISVDFGELVEFDKDLASALVDNPVEYLQHAQNAALNQLRVEDPEYFERVKGVKVRIYDLFDVTPLRSVGSEHIGKMIMVNGIVVKATVVKPKVLKAAFECKRCGTRNFVEQTTPFLVLPVRCGTPTCRRAGPFEFLESESEFVNLQDIWVQETPEELPPGQLPRSLNVKLVGDIVNSARPGDNVSIVGIVKVMPHSTRKAKLSVFDLFLEANSVKVLGKEPEAIPTLEEVNRIRELAKDPWIHRKIIASIAPSIYGYENIKEAIMYLLFGGVAKELPDIKIRGEINVLVIGDPGVAKSQLLRYVSMIAPRGLYVSGRGSSAAGLTAAVLRDKDTGEMSLEAGALVLADKGVCCIDEVEKMRPEDRSSIHTAMEQGVIAVAKGGIVATLNARTAILAAANPTFGRYEPYRSISENVPLPVTLLSRFDLIFLMRDVPDVEGDTKLCEHILSIHRKSLPELAPIPAELLRKYIGFARGVNPVLTKEASERLKEFYLEMRKASAQTEGSPIAIGPRQLEALVRIAEARARVALREEVLPEDAEAAIRIMTKTLQEVGIDVKSGKMDIDILMTGKPKSLRDKAGAILSSLLKLEKETGLVLQETLISEVSRYGITQQEAEKIIAELIRDGVIYAPREGYLKKT